MRNILTGILSFTLLTSFAMAELTPEQRKSLQSRLTDQQRGFLELVPAENRDQLLEQMEASGSIRSLMTDSEFGESQWVNRLPLELKNKMEGMTEGQIQNSDLVMESTTLSEGDAANASAVFEQTCEGYNDRDLKGICASWGLQIGKIDPAMIPGASEALSNGEVIIDNGAKSGKYKPNQQALIDKQMQGTRLVMSLMWESCSCQDHLDEYLAGSDEEDDEE